MQLKDYKQQNAIAYDEYIRQQLREIHEMLGIDVTDIATAAMIYGTKFNPEAKHILKKLSEMASELSTLLFNVKNEEGDLTDKETKDFESIKALVGYLGNLQFKLNSIIKVVDEFNVVAKKLEELGLDYADYIIKTQDKIHEVRAEINDLSFLSKNPVVAYQISANST